MASTVTSTWFFRARRTSHNRLAFNLYESIDCECVLLMIANTIWTREMGFSWRTESGHPVAFEAGATLAKGASPMEAALMALCACMSVDVVSSLEKKQEPLTSLSVSATAEQAGEQSRLFTRIKLSYLISGDVSEKAAEDAVMLSKSKYYFVSKMLDKTAEIDFVIEYVDGLCVPIAIE
jgi:putative redox protein